MIDIVTRFITDFIAQEHEALISMYTERDYQTFVRKRDRFESFLVPDLCFEMARREVVNEDWFARGARSVRSRVLFLIRKYRSPEFGDLYRCYTNHLVSFAPEDEANYFANFYVAETEASLKMISRYFIDMDDECRQPRDRGLCWNCRGGVEITTLGELVEERRFRAPVDDAHRTEYESS